MTYKKHGKAQFIGGEMFWGMLKNFRVLWLSGRYGGGKTSLAFLCAARLRAEGLAQGVVANIPCSFANDVSSLSLPSAIVLDESWIYIESRKDVYDYAAFVRKFKHYLLLPSVFPVHARLSSFSVQRVFNGYVVGFPVWWYRWNLRSKDVKEMGSFGVWNPKSIFGHYPTDFVAGDDGGISDELAKISKLAGFKGTRREQKERDYKDSITIEDETSFSNDDLRAVADEIEDSAGEFTQATEDMEKIEKAFRRHARRR